ncbi:squalene/phytoene synthase family protein [Qingshengfaniella alkalisoli]|uniref:Phytoene synthase n=1 Tax=Qingshengfaniella alkalisoli TaxID=2599296 RepID=A0A5B8J2P2_9RHOB|nr:squalene/phytoene synthase family protein [Qingshengfaniella alkalisoli]QDY68787.1 phytoene synthase [Qingshengfaniella alkalisoli]
MSLQACANLLQKGDPDRFRVAMAAPVEARKILLPLFAFNLEISRAPWVTQEPQIAEIRLQWWRDSLDQIAGGGPVRMHEVVTPMSKVLDAEGAAVLDKLIAARRWDVYTDPFEDQTHFDDYITATSGHLMWVAARALGAAKSDPVYKLAWGSGVAALLMAIPDLEARGRKPLVDGRPEAVRDLAERAMANMRDARAQRREVPSSAAPALMTAWRASDVLKRAAKHPHSVKDGLLDSSDARKKALLIWRSMTKRW